MSLEEFLGNDTFTIAAAYALLDWAKLVASKEKETKYEEVQKEVDKLADKYGVTDTDIMGARYNLDGEQPMATREELIDRADKLVACEDGWM